MKKDFEDERNDKEETYVVWVGSSFIDECLTNSLHINISLSLSLLNFRLYVFVIWWDRQIRIETHHDKKCGFVAVSSMNVFVPFF